MHQEAAAAYQELSSNAQFRVGLNFIQEIKPRPGDDILDLGCGTGELSAALADLVGCTGEVAGIDPDKDRLSLAQLTHKDKSNLHFATGSSFNYPEAKGKFDIVFSNSVLNWVSNKEDLFKKVFHSLKKGGRFASTYVCGTSTLLTKMCHEFGLENQLSNYLKNMYFENSQVVEGYLQSAGFKIVSLENQNYSSHFNCIHEYCKLYLVGTKGLIDYSSVSKERLDDFAQPLKERGELCDTFPMLEFVAIKE